MYHIVAFYFFAILLNLISTIFNIQSSLHLNPLLLHFYSAKEVLVLTMTLFTIGAIARIIFFRVDIIKDNLLKIVFLSFLGSLFGSLLLNFIPDKIIAFIFVFAAIYFILKYRKNKVDKRSGIEGLPDKNPITALLVAGFAASFMQAFGISSGPIRQGYYYSRGYSIQAVHGTVAIIFVSHSLTFLSSRVILEPGTLKLILSVLPITPFIFLTTYFAKKILYKIPDIWKDRIVIYSLVIALISIIPILFK